MPSSKFRHRTTFRTLFPDETALKQVFGNASDTKVYSISTCSKPISIRRFRTDKRRQFFTQCTVNVWNKLPKDVVVVSGIDGFKEKLGNFTEFSLNG